MDLDSILDPASLASIVEDAVDRALDALTLALAARDAAAGSASDASKARADILAMIARVGVTYQWVGTSGRQLQLLLPDNTYGPASPDLSGPQGEPGQSPVLRAGSKAVGELNFTIDNADPLNPIFNITIPAGTPGQSGWTPKLALVADGQRIVQQITDWTGGSGDKPAIGQFIGALGPTSVIASAVDVRGTAGATGTSGANFMAASTTPVPVALGTVSVTLTPATAVGFATCQYMALVSSADPRNAMAGLMQSYNPTSRALTIAMLQCSGSGTHADWIVTPSQVLTIPTFVDDGFYDGPQQSASSQTVSYVAVSPSASADDDGTY